MSRLLIQIIMIAACLMILAPVQAAFNVDTGLSACQILAVDASESGKKETDEKEGGEEEEPDCD